MTNTTTANRLTVKASFTGAIESIPTPTAQNEVVPRHRVDLDVENPVLAGGVVMTFRHLHGGDRVSTNLIGVDGGESGNAVDSVVRVTNEFSGKGQFIALTAARFNCKVPVTADRCNRLSSLVVASAKGVVASSRSSTNGEINEVHTVVGGAIDHFSSTSRDSGRDGAVELN